MKITYLGHACFTIEVADKKLIIDPYIKASSQFVGSTWQKAQNPDYILVTHAHYDHLGDTVELAKSSGATVLAPPELCRWLAGTEGVEKIYPFSMGSFVTESGIEIKMVPALHGSSIPLANGNNTYGAISCGFLVKYQNNILYHAGDTGLFGDMKLIHELHKPNIGLLPIGGRFTMDIPEAVYACKNFFSFDTVIPMHYNSLPLLAKIDPKVFQDALPGTAVKILDLGEEVQF